ncbi:Fe(3+) ions import ATP-binding protein FbpC 2 [Lonepinella sp. MS14434]|uniref:ABC transporter ATP-binding protein n=1 Tax=Lonepinella sp. MS14434 TaxID=3003617 RepID=UPI0036D7F382
MSPLPILTLSHLHKSYDGKHQVNHDISFELAKGEILTLLGPSGCGKTTLLRAIAGFERPEQGEIYIGDRLVCSPKTFIHPRDRNVGYVVQEGILFPHLSVYHNVAYGLGDGKGKLPEEQQKIGEILALTGMTNFADAMPHQLSGGQQQRVALARALVVSPALILLDEPFSALDQYLRSQIRDELLAILKRSQTSAILVTHDCEEALLCSDRIALLFNGKLVQLDTAQGMYYHPNSLEIAQFIGDTLIIDALLIASEQVQCLLGQVNIHPNNAPLDSLGKLMIRPESITLIPVDKKAKSPLNLTALASSGTLVKLLKQQFQGKHSHVWVDIAGQTLDFSLSNTFRLYTGESYILQVHERAKFYL